MELYRRYPDKESRNTPQIKDSLKQSDEDVMRVYKKRLDLEFQYIKNNPLSKTALEYLARRSTRAEGNSRLADFIAVYASLPEDTKSDYYGEYLLMAIERLQRIQAFGVVAPDFKASDINGEAVSISKYNDQKYVLIDFWASWCVPCREDHPELIELYSQFNSMIEFVSISLDTNLDAWKKAIKTDGIDAWRHVSTEENSQVNLRSTYDVGAIPLRILIDRDGKIIKRWRGADEKHVQELTTILKSIK